ncbi:MAG: Eco57I restriction-modification methylase domain-containing protein [Mitsuokella sp.]|uniref:Eco57I restriction-modification methylase domain-containing protein n=1 Tax=Mitsuokella sp. TaxID=2049034 RepID=UPI003EFD2D24
MGKKMFDYVIGNPPYQEDKADVGRQAKPIYNLFFDSIKRMDPACICLITPSRWFAGGIGLDSFRKEMLNEHHIKTIVNYPNAKMVFPNTSISGGVNYFVWDKDYDGDCNFISRLQGKENSMTRSLSEFPVLVRYNDAVKIIRKVQKENEETMDSIISAISPYGLATKVRGVAKRDVSHTIKLYSSKGASYISKDIIGKGLDTIDTYRSMISQTSAEHAGEPSSDGKFRVLTKSMQVMNPGEVCTHSYIFAGPFKTATESKNAIQYLRTKFVRFLLLQALTSIHISRSTFVFVPIQNFEESWDDKRLIEKYGLTSSEENYIDSCIKEMA